MRHPAAGRVNDVVLTLRDGAGRSAVERELRRAVAAAEPPLSAGVSTTHAVAAYRVLYDDIEGDAQLWRIIALPALGGRPSRPST